FMPRVHVVDRMRQDSGRTLVEGRINSLRFKESRELVRRGIPESGGIIFPLLGGRVLPAEIFFSLRNFASAPQVHPSPRRNVVMPFLRERAVCPRRRRRNWFRCSCSCWVRSSWLSRRARGWCRQIILCRPRRVVRSWWNFASTTPTLELRLRCRKSLP